MKNKLKKITAITAVSSLALFAGCELGSHDEDEHGHENIDGAYKNTVEYVKADKSNPELIVTTFYPTTEITKAIVGEDVKVETLIPVGAEPHSFEPTAKQIVVLSKSDVFVTMDGMFHTIEDKIIDSNKDIKIIQSAHDLELVKGDDHDHGHQEEEHQDEHNDEDIKEENHNEDEHHTTHDGHDHDLTEFDPHVWLSIHNMEKMTNEIAEALTIMYPENTEIYNQNKEKYLERLEQLETKFNEGLKVCNKDVILVNHKAFGYLAHEYGFEQISASGFTPESEPSPKTIQNVIEKAKKHNLKVIFSEGQMDKKTAQTLANEIGGQVLELNPILTTEKDYIELMEKNLENLKLGLECE